MVVCSSPNRCICDNGKFSKGRGGSSRRFGACATLERETQKRNLTKGESRAMSTIEKLMLAAFGLIALYVVLNAREAGSVIASIGSYTGGLFGTLQGAEVQFGNNVSIRRTNF